MGRRYTSPRGFAPSVMRWGLAIYLWRPACPVKGHRIKCLALAG